MAGRIEEVVEFYASGSVAGVSLISEELKGGDLLSADWKGKWALEQFEAGAKSLNVLKFLVALEKGGCELPEIYPLETYVERLLEATEQLRAKLEATFGVQERRNEQTFLDVIATETDLQLWDGAGLSDEPPSEADQLKEWKLNVKKREESKLRAEVAYAKWQAVHTAFEKDRSRVESLKESAMQKAEKQRSEDVDAVTRAKRALEMLKAHLQKLMEKVPDIVSVVRKMGPDFVDPYVAGNLRQVYANMLERYRNGDQMGVTTALIGGMRLTQGAKQPLETFMRKVEEFHQAMLFLGVKQLSIADVAAIVALGGMHVEHKSAFLEKETMVEMAVKNLEGEEEGMAGGGSDGSVFSRKGDRRTLLEKVLEFSRANEKKKMLVGNMSSGTAVSAEKDGAAGDRFKKEKDARSVLAVVSAGVRHSAEDRARHGPCYKFKEGRKCEYGEFCRYSHGEEGTKKVAFKEELAAKTLKPGPSATALFNYSKQYREKDSSDEE